MNRKPICECNQQFDNYHQLRQHRATTGHTMPDHRIMNGRGPAKDD